MSILSMLKIVHCTKIEHWCSYANPYACEYYVGVKVPEWRTGAI